MFGVVPVVGDVLDPDELEDAGRVGRGLEAGLVTHRDGLGDLHELARHRHRRARREVVVVVDADDIRLEPVERALVVPHQASDAGVYE